MPIGIAPAVRSRATAGASRLALCPASAREPALVATGSAISIFALTSTGTPWSGPRGPVRACRAFQLGCHGERARVGFEHGVESWAAAIERSDTPEVGAHGLDGRTTPVANRLRKLNGAEFRDVRDQTRHRSLKRVTKGLRLGLVCPMTPQSGSGTLHELPWRLFQGSAP